MLQFLHVLFYVVPKVSLNIPAVSQIYMSSVWFVDDLYFNYVHKMPDVLRHYTHTHIVALK